MRADFVYEPGRLVVLTDGRAFHAADPVRTVEDLDRRNALAFEGYRLLEFTYQDVVDRPAGVVETVKQALTGAPVQIGEALEDYAAIPDRRPTMTCWRKHRAARFHQFVHLRPGHQADATVYEVFDGVGGSGKEHGFFNHPYVPMDAANRFPRQITSSTRTSRSSRRLRWLVIAACRYLLPLMVTTDGTAIPRSCSSTSICLFR